MSVEKLYVEITTRCNMQCGMCVKHVPGSCISNEDMDWKVFEKLRPHFSTINRLILNGLGEPLLHPKLDKMLELASQHMQPGSERGFQTNGLLLEEERLACLIEAGLNLLCISVDSSPVDPDGTTGLLHRPNTGACPIQLTDTVRKNMGRTDFRLGGEIVITRETLPNLPSLIRNLAEKGIDYVIGSHLLAYSPDSESSSLFDTNTKEAAEIYFRHKTKAHKSGLDLTALTGKTWIAPRKQEEHDLKNIYKQMLAEAREKGIWLHYDHLEELQPDVLAEAEHFYSLCRSVAAEYDIELDLPPLSASRDRSCRFIREKALFIDTRGNVMPCHALWHNYSLYMNGKEKRFHSTSFGNLIDDDLSEIATGQPLSEFRTYADSEDLPYCHSCNPGPCPDITGESGPFVNDCFGYPVPCGHCLWCYDAVRCL